MMRFHNRIKCPSCDAPLDERTDDLRCPQPNCHALVVFAGEAWEPGHPDELALILTPGEGWQWMGRV